MIPFDILNKNKIPKSWDVYVAEKIKVTKNFSEIIGGHECLSQLPKPLARKEVAKVIYSLGLQPNLLSQKFEIKDVMGSVGEALTELLLPDIDVGVNNTGYDVEYCGNYIEVKSTITDKALLSNVQYRKANYLIVHKFNKDSGLFSSSSLVPLELLTAFKPNRTKSVSVSTKTDEWARGLKITLVRILKYFENKRKFNISEIICEKCHPIITINGGVDMKKLSVPCKGCCWGDWETRYAYYTIKLNQSDEWPKISNKRDYKFLVIETDNCKRSISRQAPIRLISKEYGFGLHFWDSAFPVNQSFSSKCKIVYDFSEIMEYMQQALNVEEDIREFEIYIKGNTVHCMIRSNLAPISPGFYSHEFKIGCEPMFIKRAREIVEQVRIKINA